jgi:integrase/recombinase XerD
MMSKSEPTLQCLVQDFFVHYLSAQKNVSSRTIESYRDAIKLFLKFISSEKNTKVCNLALEDITTDSILDFLNYLEEVRGNHPRSRNARLAVIKSFFNYISIRCPSHLDRIRKILSIPRKKYDTPIMTYLERDEMETIMDSFDKDSFSGMRDFVLFTFMYNTGARLSEAINVTRADIDFNKSGTVLIHGKGRKQRKMPLWKSTVKLLKNWINSGHIEDCDYIFPNRKGECLTRSAVEGRLKIAVKAASKVDTGLIRKNITPHTIRHTTAMHLLQAGVDITIIALWLGHSSPKTTHIYVEADLQMKKEALSKVQPPQYKNKFYKATDQTLEFLNSM